MRKRWMLAAAATMAIGLGVAWAQQPALPPQSALTEDLAQVRAEIAAAQAERQQYSSGLIVVMLDMRLQILRTTEAMLDQREKAGRWRVTVNYQPEGNWLRISPEESARIERETEAAQRDLEAAEAEAARWSGGLVLALSQLRVTQARVALTALRQQHAMARLGLAMPSPGNAASSPAQTPSTPGRVTSDREALQ